MKDERSGSEIVLDVAACADRPGYSLSGYRAAPPRGGGRGVLVVGEQGTISALARDTADRLARAGFVALAPDVPPSGVAPSDVGLEASVSVLAAGVSALLDDHAVEGSRLGALGFARGGVLALGLAAAQRRVGAAIDFYGLPDDGEAEALRGLEVPSLLLFGAADGRADADALKALASRIPNARLHVEPDAGEGYMDARVPDRHSAVAAASGWDRALAFLAATL